VIMVNQMGSFFEMIMRKTTMRMRGELVENEFITKDDELDDDTSADCSGSNSALAPDSLLPSLSTLPI